MSSHPIRQIDELVKSTPVVLFMKGTKSFPQCGFSATVVQILNRLLPDYMTVNVLADPAVRDGIKTYSNWPTIPQLYINGEFIGGCDIVKELFASGELQRKLGVEAKKVEAPRITITAGAAKVLGMALADAQPGDVVHLKIDERFDHALAMGAREPGEIEVVSNGITLMLDPDSAERAKDLKIDFVEGDASGFKIDNPQAPPRVVVLQPRELEAKLKAGGLRLFDVRTASEREQAHIEGSRLLDDAVMAEIAALPKDTPIAFYCHRGMRSMGAAQHFRDQGFREVYNLAGGIDAWSEVVDPKVPRY